MEWQWRLLIIILLIFYCWHAWVAPSTMPPSGQERSSPRPSRGLPSCWSSSGHGPLPSWSQTPRRQFHKLLFFRKRKREGEKKNVNKKWCVNYFSFSLFFTGQGISLSWVESKAHALWYARIWVCSCQCCQTSLFRCSGVVFFVLFFFLLISVTWNRVLWFFFCEFLAFSEKPMLGKKKSGLTNYPSFFRYERQWQLQYNPLIAFISLFPFLFTFKWQQARESKQKSIFGRTVIKNEQVSFFLRFSFFELF